ncbi:MAG: carbohydrate ABC transporter permease [Candidatus Parvarchaeota archaeon]|nr:carbohydrate ABC transporter permease [Candidatus Jingweiarchaeum tengchongense]
MKSKKRLEKFTIGVIGFVIAIIFFFPIFWMFLTSFKTEVGAFSIPPEFLFKPVLTAYQAVFARGDVQKYFINTIISSFGSTLIALIVAIPASYSLAFLKPKGRNFTLLWIISTKMMPPVGVLIPIYIVYTNLGLIDNIWGLTAIYVMMNLPIMVWLLFDTFSNIPLEILEAAKIDGASTYKLITNVLLPISKSGIWSASLLSVILAWNEGFWCVNLTNVNAATLGVFISSFKAGEGLYWAKMSAISTLAVIPVIILGWIVQTQIVRGLTFGALKE